jgi:hypothetical protein
MRIPQEINAFVSMVLAGSAHCRGPKEISRILLISAMLHGSLATVSNELKDR